MTFTESAKRFMLACAGASLLLSINACGSGGGGGGTPSVAAPLQGVFVDSPVQGLGYTAIPSGLSGLTDANGQFNYNPGDTVAFSLFGRVIGTAVPTAPVVTALSVFNATSVTDPRVLNLSQLLLTLGGIPVGSSPITVPTTFPAGLPNPLDFSSPTFDADLQAAGITLVLEATATTHLQANFSTLSVTLAGSGAGGAIVSSNPTGISCGAICLLDFSKGTAVALTATGAGFTGWSGGCAGTGACVVTLNANTSVIATFTTVPVNANVTVTTAGNGTGTVTSSPAGINCGVICSAQLLQGTVDLTAIAANGSTFAGWSNGTGNARNASCTGTGVCSIPLTVDSTVTAIFTLNAVPVSVTANIASGSGGSGTVQCSANGGSPGACGSYPVGAAMVLTATPNSVSNFTGWSGAGCSGAGTCNFTLRANTTVTANFNRPTLTVQVTGTGSVSSNPTGINACTTNCTALFDKGAVILTASGVGFAGWSGVGCAGTGNCVVTLSQNTTVTASFGPVIGSARYHFFMTSNGTLLGTNGPLLAVDPAAPTATPVTIATDVSTSSRVYSSIWDAATTSFSSYQPVFQVYDSSGKLWRVNVAKSSGAPGSASNPHIQISSESAATHVCAFQVVNDVTSPNARRLFYELPGADGQCGLSGLGGTRADNITKFVSLADGPTVAPTVLPTGLSIPLERRLVYNFSSGIATHMFLIDAANSNTLKIMNLATQAITTIQANIGDISIAQDTSNRVLLHSHAASTLYLYTVSSNTLTPLIAGVSFGYQSDGTSLFVADTTAGIIYRVPLTATAAGQVTPILNLGGQIYNYVATTNRIYVTVPSGTPIPNGTKIISVPKSGGAFREDVPAVAGDIINPSLGTSNGLFYYTRFTPSGNFQTVVNSTTVALNENGVPAASFPNTGQAGFITSAPFNLRALTSTPSKMLVSTYVGGVFSGGTMTAIDAATGLPAITVGTVPPTVGTNLIFGDLVDNAALGIGLLPASANWGVFFMDSAISNSLVQVPIAPGPWFVAAQ